jgi:hypothetical protein
MAKKIRIRHLMLNINDLSYKQYDNTKILNILFAKATKKK